MLALVVGAAALKIAITGSNSGIGLAASRQLLADGHDIIHACRSADAAASAASAAGGGTPMVCNLADLASVRKFAAELPSDVDVLCLNAGVSPSRKEEAPTRTVDGFQETWGVNHLAHFLLASLAQPQLAANKARLVITASGVHDPESPGGLVQNDPATGATLGDLSGLAAGAAMADGGAYNGAKAYHDSKLMNVLFCNEASKRWGGIDVAAFNPGLVTSTGLFREAKKDNFIGASIFCFAAEKIAGFAVPVEVAGERLAYMATSADVKSGEYLSAPSATSKAASKADGFDVANISKEARDAALAARLWERSAALVGI